MKKGQGGESGVKQERKRRRDGTKDEGASEKGWCEERDGVERRGT